MKINESLITDNAKEFGKDFLTEVNKYPLGSLTKTDYECLIAGLLKKYKLIGATSKEMSVALQTTPAVVRNMQIRYHVKFEDDNWKQSVQDIIHSLFSESKNAKLNFENGYFIFMVDNPVARDDFRNFIESKGYYTDTSFNSNIIKIKPIALLNCMQEFESEVFNKINNNIQKSSDLSEDVKARINDQKWNDLKTILKDNSLSILVDIILKFIP